MVLVTVEEQLKSLRIAVRQAQARADEAMRYAESTARLHHQAICRLNLSLTGSYGWPAQK